MKIFVTAIGTDSGKTLVSAILTEALEADYWKPVQAGLPKDSDTVRSLITNKKSRIHPEAYFLKSPESPHSASKKENIVINLDKIRIPVTDNHLIVEGAGGILVPLNDKDFVIDIARNNSLSIILVSNIYLGNINHTLLSIEELRRRQLPLKGIVFNGENPETEDIILKKAACPCLLRIKREEVITAQVVRQYALLVRETLNSHQSIDF